MPEEVHEDAGAPRVLVPQDPRQTARPERRQHPAPTLVARDDPEPEPLARPRQVAVEEHVALARHHHVDGEAARHQRGAAHLPVAQVRAQQDDPPPLPHRRLHHLQPGHPGTLPHLAGTHPRQPEHGHGLGAQVRVAAAPDIPPPTLVRLRKGAAEVVAHHGPTGAAHARRHPAERGPGPVGDHLRQDGAHPGDDPQQHVLHPVAQRLSGHRNWSSRSRR